MTPIKKQVLINGSFAQSVANFRGPLIEKLRYLGYEVHVSVPDVSVKDRRTIEDLDAIVHEVPLQRTGTSALADLRYYRALSRVIRKIEPAFVLGYTIKPNIWGSLAAQAEGVPSASMVTGLGYTFDTQKTFKQTAVFAVSRLLYRKATNANRAVIFQNPDDRQDFLSSRFLTDPNKAKIVNGSGVDLRHFEPAPLPEKPVFLMVCRLLVSKGVREYAEAAIRILKNRPDCRFLLAGNLDDSPDCVKASELQSWQGAGIEYLGWVDDVRIPLREASVFVLPSFYREGTPRTILEAMALQRPVITTDAPGCRETVIDGETGILVPVKDSAALEIAMQRLADDPALRAQMAQSGRDYCEEKYAVDKVNDALIGYLGL